MQSDICAMHIQLLALRGRPNFPNVYLYTQNCDGQAAIVVPDSLAPSALQNCAWHWRLAQCMRSPSGTSYSQSCITAAGHKIASGSAKGGTRTPL